MTERKTRITTYEELEKASNASKVIRSAVLQGLWDVRSSSYGALPDDFPVCYREFPIDPKRDSQPPIQKLPVIVAIANGVDQRHANGIRVTQDSMGYFNASHRMEYLDFSLKPSGEMLLEELEIDEVKVGQVILGKRGTILPVTKLGFWRNSFDNPESAPPIHALGFCISRYELMQAYYGLQGNVFPIEITRDMYMGFGRHNWVWTEDQLLTESIAIREHQEALLKWELLERGVDLHTSNSEEEVDKWRRDPHRFHDQTSDKIGTTLQRLEENSTAIHPTRKVYWGEDKPIHGIAQRLGYSEYRRLRQFGIRVEISNVSELGIDKRLLKHPVDEGDSQNAEIYLIKGPRDVTMTLGQKSKGDNYKAKEVIKESEQEFWVRVLAEMKLVPFESEETAERKRNERKYKRFR